ncbi:extensin family protein [Pararhodobacter oceanensis]|uniref:Extensin-like protein n=1 Tax=Pararhodobacter oceanensis TaxID=2172121 RepID=A0A2T8HYV9_9RHOB|nr:extensin family protein [Pararhodobacter oceanensis]PVH30626.1 extensin-like protein [Pararhodobacter oceanensis]
MRRLAGAGMICALLAIAGAAAAQVPWHSLFPRPRPAHLGGATGTLPLNVPLLVPQTDGAVAQALGVGTQSALPSPPPLSPPASPLTLVDPRLPGVARSLHPRARSRAAAARFAAAQARLVQTRPAQVARVAAPLRGASGGVRQGICGSRALQGRQLPRIRAATRGCGVEEPVSITAVHGIPLSQPATVDCALGRAFADWVQGAMLPAVGRRGGGVAQIRVIGDYSCRTRNNRPGARISEHGRGMAIDVAGYRLNNGDVVRVDRHWRRRPHRSDLRAMYSAACGIFRTTLGPEADRYHQDHFHFDLARHRNGGTYCR